ncbi:MAG: hypothetical protein JSV88_05015, partial [Candidatus Aminicenantes bacterium]
MSLRKIASVELDRLINLIHVPEINREFNKLHDRLKDIDIQQHIMDFKIRKRELFMELYMKRWECNEVSRAVGDFYWFELTCYGPGDWRLTMSYPLHDVSIVPQYEILPHQVIEKIIDTPVKPNETRSAFNLKSEFWRKVVNVKFCRLSEGFICGTVELCKRMKGDIDAKKNLNIASRDFEMAFRKFYYLFSHQPGLIYSFILDFLKAKIPGLKIMGGKGQEVNLAGLPLKIPERCLLIEKYYIQMLEKDIVQEGIN